MYILKTAYTWLPTGDRFEQRVAFKNEKDSNKGLKVAFEVADSILEDECVGEYEIELTYTNIIFKETVRREDRSRIPVELCEHIVDICEEG